MELEHFWRILFGQLITLRVRIIEEKYSKNWK